MKLIIRVLFLNLLVFSCKTNNNNFVGGDKTKNDFTIAFGSCNKQDSENILWKEILKNKPNLWIWGGDNIYSDTDNMLKMQKDYNKVLQQSEYIKLVESTEILGTWDDHDYGLNDGGAEFNAKKDSQKLFLDFLGVSNNDKRRQREGVYHSQVFKTGKGTLKVIILDTRYFRSALTDAKDSKKRYRPNTYGQGTVLGKKQWLWLENELYNTKADSNMIVSSIQFLSAEHGFETWGNFPHEVDKFKQLIKQSQAKNVLFLSGDRHISEFSKTTVDSLGFPLIDFTSSGLTHAYSGYSFEPNDYRFGKVINQISFGLLKINFDTKIIKMEMRGKGNVLLQEFLQKY